MSEARHTVKHNRRKEPRMPATVTLLPRTNDLVQERHGFRIHQLTETRARITLPSGAVVAYLDCVAAGCWALSRMSANRRELVRIGIFDSREEAIAVLRH